MAQFSFKKLSRLPMRPQEEKADKELWQPKWRCFGCHDTGLVISRLAALVIEGFDPNSDKLPRCQNLGCDAGEQYDLPNLTHCIDYRLNSEICRQLDQLERDDWRNTLLSWQKEGKVFIDYGSTVKSLRRGKRSKEEDYEAKRRHEDIRKFH
ncbi:MAG: hypothetical protein AB4041_19310 [Microcystaceae cyanobacterium]